MPVRLHWSARSGWVISDADGSIVGRPWDTEKDEQGILPPLGTWVSCKGAKSYVYEQQIATS